jgi:hypothetical protein
MENLDPLAFAASLSVQDRKRLFENLTFEFSERGGKAVRPAQAYSQSETEFFDALVSSLGNSTAYKTMPMDSLVNTKGLGRETYRNQVQFVNTYITNGCKIQLSPLHRAAIMRKVFYCLGQLLAKRWNLPSASSLTPRDILLPVNFVQLEAAVERHFPDYARAGNLHFIAQAVKISKAA